MFIGDKTIDTLKNVFMQELESLFPQVMKQFAANLKNDPKVEEMITSKLAAISPQKLETMLSAPLRAIGLLGAITGFVVGCLQLVLILLIQ
jgi:uncharacterized membrane protein YheB (UPF0754 family)